MKAILIILGLGFGSQSLAQNLISNSEFDTGVMGWSNDFVTFHWFDVFGNDDFSGPGSMEVMEFSNNNASFGVYSDPFPVNEEYWYWSSQWFYVPFGSSVPRAWFWLEFFDSGGSSLGHSDSHDSIYGVPTGAWFPLSGFIQAPAGAVTGQLKIYFQTGDVMDTDLPSGFWDDVFLYPETIYASGFD